MRIALALLAAATLSACGNTDNPVAPTPSGGVGATPPPPATTTSTTTVPPTTTTTSAPAQRIVRQTSFQDANGYQTAGTARIVQTGSAFTLELLDDFRTSQSAALDVRLCNEPNCRNGAMLDLGEIQRFSGRQSYDLPDSGAQYSHAVIYCRAVRLAFGFGVLR